MTSILIFPTLPAYFVIAKFLILNYANEKITIYAQHVNIFDIFLSNIFSYRNIRNWSYVNKLSEFAKKNEIKTSKNHQKLQEN